MCESDHINFPLHHGEVLTVFVGYGKPLEQYSNSSHGDIWFSVPLFTKSYIKSDYAILEGLGCSGQAYPIEHNGLIGYVAISKQKLLRKHRVGDK